MTDTSRTADLKQMLTARRRQMQNDVQTRLRHGRGDERKEGDDLEHSDADIQGDLAVALLQMTAETVVRIDEALARLDAGKYGACFECEGEIAEPRLRALPFAVRCQACEQRREKELGPARRAAQRRGHHSLFADSIGS